MKRASKIGYLNGIAASVSYGLNPLFALPLIARGTGVLSVVFYRYAFASVIYWAILKFVKKVDFRVSVREFFALMFVGTMFTASSLFLFVSFKYIDSGTACTILFVYPVIVAVIMSLFFGEKFSKRTFAAVIVAFSGIALLNKSGSAHGGSFFGYLNIMLSALSYALYIVFVRTLKVLKHVHKEILTFYVMLSGVILYFVGLKFGMNTQPLSTPFHWVCALGLAVFPTIISIETINISIKLIGAVKTALLGALEPLTAVFVGLIVFKEHLSAAGVLGILLIIGSVSSVILRKN